MRLYLAVGDVSDILKGNIYYNPINPPVGLEGDYAKKPTAIEMHVSSRQMPFDINLKGITRLEISGLNAEVPAIGKRFTEDQHIEVTLSEGMLEVRGIAYREKEYYENKHYELEFEGNAPTPD